MSKEFIDKVIALDELLTLREKLSKSTLEDKRGQISADIEERRQRLAELKKATPPDDDTATKDQYVQAQLGEKLQSDPEFRAKALAAQTQEPAPAPAQEAPVQEAPTPEATPVQEPEIEEPQKKEKNPEDIPNLAYRGNIPNRPGERHHDVHSSVGINGKRLIFYKASQKDPNTGKRVPIIDPKTGEQQIRQRYVPNKVQTHHVFVAEKSKDPKTGELTDVIDPETGNIKGKWVHHSTKHENEGLNVDGTKKEKVGERSISDEEIEQYSEDATEAAKAKQEKDARFDPANKTPEQLESAKAAEDKAKEERREKELKSLEPKSTKKKSKTTIKPEMSDAEIKAKLKAIMDRQEGKGDKKSSYRNTDRADIEAGKKILSQGKDNVKVKKKTESEEKSSEAPKTKTKKKSQVDAERKAKEEDDAKRLAAVLGEEKEKVTKSQEIKGRLEEFKKAMKTGGIDGDGIKNVLPSIGQASAIKPTKLNTNQMKNPFEDLTLKAPTIKSEIIKFDNNSQWSLTKDEGSKMTSEEHLEAAKSWAKMGNSKMANMHSKAALESALPLTPDQEAEAKEQGKKLTKEEMEKENTLGDAGTKSTYSGFGGIISGQTPAPKGGGGYGGGVNQSPQ